MGCIRWLHYTVVIIFLHVFVNAMASQSDEVVECAFMENENLWFYCRGSVDKENSRKDSYFCCESYLYCYGGGWQYKSSILSTEFVDGCQFPRFEFNFFKSYSAIRNLSLSNVGLE